MPRIDDTSAESRARPTRSSTRGDRANSTLREAARPLGSVDRRGRLGWRGAAALAPHAARLCQAGTGGPDEQDGTIWD